MLDAAIRDRNDKAWNRASAELLEAEFMLTIATEDAAAAKSEVEVYDAQITVLENTLTQQRKNY
jgi:head-tail adaptor